MRALEDELLDLVKMKNSMPKSEQVLAPLRSSHIVRLSSLQISDHRLADTSPAISMLLYT